MWQNYKKNQDKTYGELLDRVKSSLPELKVDDNRFIIPQVDSQIQGNRTFLRNFKEIVNILNRQESHFLKFITNELGTAASLQSGQAIFQGKHAKFQITKLLERYVNDYVLCPECNKPETKFTTQGRIPMMKCDACGASSSLRAVS